MRVRSFILAVLVLTGAGAVAVYYYPREQPASRPTEKQAVGSQQPTEPHAPQPQSSAETPNTAGNGERAAQPSSQFAHGPASETAQAPEAGQIKQSAGSGKADRSSPSNPPSSGGPPSPSPQVAEAPGQTNAPSAAAGPQTGRASQQQAILPPRELSLTGVRSLQQALSRAGFDPGRPDGKWGRRTERALRAFQEAKRLPAPGTLDAQTVEALGLDPALFAQGDPGAAHAEKR